MIITSSWCAWHWSRSRIWPGSDPSPLEEECGVLSLGPTGVQPLVQCLSFGRINGTTFTPLPGGSGKINRNGPTTARNAAW